MKPVREVRYKNPKPITLAKQAAWRLYKELSVIEDLVLSTGAHGNLGPLGILKRKAIENIDFVIARNILPPHCARKEHDDPSRNF